MSSVDEIRRLASGPSEKGPSGGLAAHMTVYCTGHADDLLKKVKEVLTIVFGSPPHTAIETSEWREKLPDWFIRQFADEITREEAERRRRLPEIERIALAQQWALSGWLYWFIEENRSWKWWNAEITSANSLTITLEVPGFPYPSGALEWLLKCAGAIRVDGGL